jgi:hypothetical protein
MLVDMIETKEGVWVPILESHLVRHDGRIGIHMRLQYKHDAIHMRDTDEVVWVKKKLNTDDPYLELTHEEE